MLDASGDGMPRSVGFSIAICRSVLSNWLAPSGSGGSGVPDFAASAIRAASF
jgi:hypothetical protein